MLYGKLKNHCKLIKEISLILMVNYSGKSQFMFSLIAGNVLRKNVMFDDKLTDYYHLVRMNYTQEIKEGM